MFPIVCIQTLLLDIFSNVTIHNDYLAASLFHLLLFTGPYPKLNLELASYFAKQSSRRQTCPRKTDHPTDPRLWRYSLQHFTQQTGCSLSQCHPFCHQSPIYHPPLPPVRSRRLALATYSSPDPLAPGHL
jgi:hypothetical protein